MRTPRSDSKPEVLRRHLRLYLIADPDFTGGRLLADIVTASVRGGATMVQLRDKGDDVRRFLAQAVAMKRQLAGTGVPLIINDRLDVALAAGADGVHLGQSDMPVREARRLLGRDAIIGLSIEAAAQLDDAAALADADYLGVGPVFATATKADAAPPLGLGGLAAIRARSNLPMVAIGGITADNAGAIIETGVDGLAVVTAIMAADDPAAAAARLRTLAGV